MNTAAELFYRCGINNTGIDRIIADAGVAKASMYNHFTGKEEIVVTYLKTIRKGFTDALANVPVKKGPTFQVSFQMLKGTLANGEFYGCPFSNALVEMPDSPLVKQEVVAHRDTVLHYFESSVDGDKTTAAMLMVVYDGAFLNCKLNPNGNTVNIAMQIAGLIVKDGKQRSEVRSNK